MKNKEINNFMSYSLLMSFSNNFILTSLSTLSISISILFMITTSTIIKILNIFYNKLNAFQFNSMLLSSNHILYITLMNSNHHKHVDSFVIQCTRTEVGIIKRRIEVSVSLFTHSGDVHECMHTYKCKHAMYALHIYMYIYVYIYIYLSACGDILHEYCYVIVYQI